MYYYKVEMKLRYDNSRSNKKKCTVLGSTYLSPGGTGKVKVKKYEPFSETDKVNSWIAAY